MAPRRAPPPKAAPGSPPQATLSAPVLAMLKSIEPLGDQVGLSDVSFESHRKKLNALTGKARLDTAAELLVLVKRFGSEAGPAAARFLAQLNVMVLMLVSRPTPAAEARKR